MKSIEQEWKHFARKIFAGASIPKVQYDCMQLAFFAGAMTMFEGANKAAELSEEEGLAYLSARQEEFRQFSKEADKRLKKGF